MKSAEIRAAFLSFFNQRKHHIVASSSLVPVGDDTLLFTNAGMVPFKALFLGQESRDYHRATSAQRCVRAGGKHNDLENVGYTARHHTFFEMLGNFSFGDYFKREAIQFAWEFITGELKLEPTKLWVTVHISDDEAADIWLNEIGVSPDRFSRLDEDNFWQMGDTGPCGPSSEIFYDHGADIAGGPPGSDHDDLDRYIEIWNLVFMQYERQADGELKPLPKPSVDTGMGLERIAAVMQGVHNNYDIDLFKGLLNAAAKCLNIEYSAQQSLRVIADHIRSCSFLIVDGVLPDRVGRGYVLRRIIRRAVRHGNSLGATTPFFYKLVPALVEQMGEAYPELADKASTIESVLLKEEQQFAKTLSRGLSILNSELSKVKGKVVPGSVVFMLYDTYGFPTDLTNDIAREKGYTLDMDAYDELMKVQAENASNSGKFSQDYTKTLVSEGATKFSGYKQHEVQAAIRHLYQGGQSVDSISSGEQAIIVTETTPFYAESGGQIADTGQVTLDDGSVFNVSDCQKNGDNHLHIGEVTGGQFAIGDTVKLTIDEKARQRIAAHHSATHLLHAALREHLGEHVTQKGSLVDADKLRFDFSHDQALSEEDIAALEHRVNTVVLANTPIETEVLSMEAAKEKGAMALFGEKYGEEVRVLSMGEEGFSVELCGGTHVSRTGDIGLFKVVSESGIASGVRRIEAIAGTPALDYVHEQTLLINRLSRTLKAASDQLNEKATNVMAQVKSQEKIITQLNAKLASAASQSLLDNIKMIGDCQVLAHKVDGLDAKGLRDLADSVKSKLTHGIFMLASFNGEKISLVSGATKQSGLHAGKLMQAVAPMVGGKGGGRPDMAQGAGSDPSKITQALDHVMQWVEQQLND